MTDPDTIRETYERHEKALGGPGWAKEACEAAAEELGLPYEDVRGVMLDAWTQQGAG